MAITINLVKPEPGHDEQNHPRINNTETVASYSWLDEPTPTILVPGILPVWDPPQITPVLKPNAGGRYVNQYADRNPGSPLQALIQAVQTCQPGFDFSEVSIVTDRKPIRNLLGFVSTEPFAFQFGINVIGNTALFTRMENRTRDQPAIHFRGYRDAFEEKYTRISASASRTTSHHRVLKYDFADQKILVRYAVDAYLGDVAKALMQAHGIDSTDLAPLVNRHKNMDIKGDSPFRILPSNTPVTVIHGGCHIPHAATLELTTRAEHSHAPDNIECKMPEFWISQTLSYHLCFHREKVDESSRSTIFNCIRLIPMGELLTAWEKTNAEKLRALGHILVQVREAAKELGGSCIVSSDGAERASLSVSRAEEEEAPALPEYMQSLFTPIKNKTVDVPIGKEELAITENTAGQDATRKRKYGTNDAPELTSSPPARRIAPNSTFRAPGETSIPTENGKLATTASTPPRDGTRKRKIDGEHAPELTDPSSTKRVLGSKLRAPRQADTSIKEEEPSVKIKDEPVDTEMVI